MAEKPKAVVTASFEIPAKLAHHLEELLRGLTAHVYCTVLQVTTEVQSDAKSELQQVKSGRGRQQQGDGIQPANGNAGKDGELAGRAGKGKRQSRGGDAAKGLDGVVRSKKSRTLKPA